MGESRQDEADNLLLDELAAEHQAILDAFEEAENEGDIDFSPESEGEAKASLRKVSNSILEG